MPESVGADASDMGARSAGNAARSGPGVHGGPPRGRHGSIARQLSVAVSSSAWCLGDWLRYGEAAYASRYRDAIQQTSLDYQTLRTMPGWPGGSRCPAGGTP